MATKPWPHCLGDTPEEIAATLQAQGVRGIPLNPRCCIIARSYKHHTKNRGWSGLKVNYRKGTKDRQPVGKLTFNDLQIMDPDCPPQVALFMQQFDAGKYPELIAAALPAKQTVLAKVLAQLSEEEKIALGY